MLLENISVRMSLLKLFDVRPSIVNSKLKVYSFGCLAKTFMTKLLEELVLMMKANRVSRKAERYLYLTAYPLMKLLIT